MDHRRPLRLVAQDIGFSVRRQGFDSPRGCFLTLIAALQAAFFLRQVIDFIALAYFHPLSVSMARCVDVGFCVGLCRISGKITPPSKASFLVGG